MSRKHTFRSRPPALLIALFMLIPAGAFAPAEGQISGDGDSRNEGRLLRAAAAREARGEFTEAEELLLQLLGENPTSSSGIFALERVMRAQGRLRDVLPSVDRFLEEDPDATGTRYLKLRVLMEVDSLKALREEAERWIDEDPGALDPYREVARVLQRAFGPAEALSVLLRGREATGNPLALEIGDLRLEMGDPAGAVREWTDALGPQAAGLNAVLHRILQLPAERAELTRPLVESMGAGDATLAQRRAAAQIALEAGLEEEAVVLAEGITQELKGTARRGFLLELGRRADSNRAHLASLWIYQALREDAEDPLEQRSLDQRIAGAALAVGDTLAALGAQQRVAARMPAGSPERRRALAKALRLQGSVASLSRLSAELERFRNEFPGSPEVDDLAAALADRLRQRGDREGALEVLSGVEGPRSAMERGFLLLERGALEEGREALGEALEMLAPSEATKVVALLGIFQRVEPEAAQLAGRSFAFAQRGDAQRALDQLDSGIQELRMEDRPPLLALAARIADHAGDTERGALYREEMIDGFPDAPETPEAALSLARYHAGSPEGLDLAVQLLEALIISRPGSAVVPTARRELERVRRRLEGRG